MHISSFHDAVVWVTTHGYFLILLAMIIEGPVITAAATFVVALGYFSLPLVFLFSVLGDLIADIIFYAIGYTGRLALIERIAPKLGLSIARIHKLEKQLHTHSGKTIAAIKLNPITPMPGLMLIGALRLPLRRFMLVCLLITMPKTILFMLVGYYFGTFYDTFVTKLNNVPLTIGIILVVAIIFFFLFRKFSVQISNFFWKE